MKIFLKILFAPVLLPYYLVKWIILWRRARRRRRNYEILGHYVALLGNNPNILGYFRKLIEEGIREEKLLALLDTNLTRLQQFENDQKREGVRSKLEEEIDAKEFAAEQKELLHQARVSLEQIKFREKLLEGLYHKIQKKYKM